MSYRLFIFDFDGTLADTRARMANIVNLAAARFNFRQLSEADIEALRGRDNRAIIKEMGVPMWKLPLIARYVRRLANEEPTPAPLFAGVPEMMQHLHAAGATLAVVSSNSEAAVRRTLGGDLAERIHIYECEAALFGKATKFKRVLKRARIARGEALSIGDETRDIEAARAAGVACGAVAWGYATADILKAQRPDAFFTTPEEIAQLIRPAQAV